MSFSPFCHNFFCVSLSWSGHPLASWILARQDVIKRDVLTVEGTPVFNQGNTQDDAAKLIVEAAAESRPLQVALQSNRCRPQELSLQVFI